MVKTSVELSWDSIPSYVSIIDLEIDAKCTDNTP